jgi:hypothetical protein
LEPDEIPPGVPLPKPDSLVFPVVPSWITENAVRNPYPGGPDRLNDPRFYVKSISNSSGRIEAEIEVVEYEPINRVSVDRRVSIQKVPAGGIFKIAGKRFRVRNLVPPNTRTKVIGWVELVAEKDE